MTPRETIITTIAQHLDKRADTITDTHTLADLGADSLDAVEIAMGIEDAFGLPEHMPDAVMETGTVGEIVAAVEAVVG